MKWLEIREAPEAAMADPEKTAAAPVPKKPRYTKRALELQARLKKAAADADAGRGTDITNVSREEMIKSLFGK